MTRESCENTAITLRRMNVSGYVGHSTIFSECLLRRAVYRSMISVTFCSVELVCGCAHVYSLLSLNGTLLSKPVCCKVELVGFGRVLYIFNLAHILPAQCCHKCPITKCS